MRKYCEKCNKEVETKVMKLEETYEIHGEPITVETDVRVCAECGEDLWDEKLDDATLLATYNEYRKKHNLLFPDEIKEIREKYGLSQRGFARILGWGDETLKRYERGGAQDKARDSLLVFMKDPKNMAKYLEENKGSIDPKLFAKVQTAIKTLEKGGEETFLPVPGDFLRSFFPPSPCKENGFRTFDYEKFAAMVWFFAGKEDAGKVLETKLMGLLYYSDMFFFKKNCVSISGERYVRRSCGPVPENFELLLGVMEFERIVRADVLLEDGYEKHVVVADEGIFENILSEKETAMLEKVWEKFKDFGAEEMSDYLYRGKGYAETEEGKVISYIRNASFCSG